MAEHGVGGDVADEHAALDQAGENRVWIRDFKENEVGVRGIGRNAICLREGLEDALAFGTDKRNAFGDEGFVFEDGHGRGVREDVDVKGDFAFDDLVSQARMGDEIADADARGAVGFGQGFEHDEVGVFGQEVHGGLRVKFAIRLVDHDQGVCAGQEAVEVAV